jgi:hypothetical protein
MLQRCQDARMPTSNEQMAIYLNDHLAGSVTALELIGYAARQHAGTPLGAFLTDLRQEIKQDQRVLREILLAVGGTPQRHKLAAAWLVEKAGRLKFNGQLLKRSPLTDMLELETITIGIHGKAQGWRALREAAGQDLFAGHDLGELIERAQRQHEAVEAHRREAARRALR